MIQGEVLVESKLHCLQCFFVRSGLLVWLINQNGNCMNIFNYKHVEKAKLFLILDVKICSFYFPISNSQVITYDFWIHVKQQHL